jgi:hypothetical protein
MSIEDMPVSETTIREWRSSGLITAEEIAYKSGDLFVAENVITKNRRIITPSIKESLGNKRVLRG